MREPTMHSQRRQLGRPAALAHSATYRGPGLWIDDALHFLVLQHYPQLSNIGQELPAHRGTPRLARRALVGPVRRAT